jgi:hypothetical protein
MLKYFIIFTFILCIVHSYALYAAEANNTPKGIEDKETIEPENAKWTGIDVSIVGKYAEKYGHPPRDPYINTDQGDLLLFVFTFFGLVGGIIIGYNFRKLFVEGKDKNNLQGKKI